MAKQSYYGDPYNQGDFNWTTKFGEKPKTEGEKIDTGTYTEEGPIDTGELGPDGKPLMSKKDIDIESLTNLQKQRRLAKENEEFDKTVAGGTLEDLRKGVDIKKKTALERIEDMFEPLTSGAEEFNRKRQLGIDSTAQTVDDIVTGGLEKLNVPGSEYIGDRARNITGFLTDVVAPTAEDLALSGAISALATPAAGGVSLAALRTRRLLQFGDEALEFFTKIPTVISHQRGGRLGALIDGQVIDRANLSKIFMDDQLARQSAQPMRIKGSGSQKAWKSKRVVKGFDDAQLQVYDEAAWDYRRARASEGKKQFMKGFVFENNSPVIRNKSGQEFMMVRKKKVNHPDKTHPDNYVLKSIWDVENDLITKAGWTKGAKEMDQLRDSLNRLRANHPDEFYHVLMEYGDNAYLEHKVAKKQPWFWNRKSQDSNFASWLDNSITRNSEGNIRLLFNESFKSLKDVTESKLRVINKTIKDDNFKYVIDLEDPIGGDFARRSNPGNILIREADSGDIIGIIPDYLQELFTTNFERNFNNSKMRGILSKPDIPEFYRIQPNETMKNYRSRILDERIQLIRNKAGQFDRTGMTGHINKDLVDFYELFDRKLGWVETPRYITEQGLYD